MRKYSSVADAEHCTPQERHSEKPMWLGRGFDSDGDGENDLFIVTHIDSKTREAIGKVLTAVIVLLAIGLALYYGALFTVDVTQRASSFLWQNIGAILWLLWGGFIAFALVVTLVCVALSRSSSGATPTLNVAKIVANIGAAIVGCVLLLAVVVGVGFIGIGVFCAIEVAWDDTLAKAAVNSAEQVRERDRINQLAEISVQEAKAFAKRRGPLPLNSLTMLSMDVARALARHQGDLSLNGLTTLSDDPARALAQHQHQLSLNGLLSLSDKAASALSQHKGRLSLEGLTALSSAQLASKLASGDKTLQLDRVATLSDEAAKALAQQKDGLYLDGLTTLSDEAAKALAEHKGFCLRLNGLTMLSDNAAKALALHKGYQLELNGLETLSDRAARALARCKGWLSLNGLTALSDVAAKALQANSKITLPSKFSR